ncbi:hypothetical protein BV25DRAFT_1912390 [Artomyces pyxidatus]|uniref:Uncharacterized protein n=1 Tax=Artomyces pyxidatus TaxID=48021 RepID=A0ACB8TF73_9AGAM|nr:hypothetical protein BV25DRAFT_1912390 [Artomyces pyxidatus]
MPDSVFKARPCDKNGVFLPPDSPPVVDEEQDDTDWSPFRDRPTYHFAELSFEKMETSAENLKELLQVLEARDILDGIEREPIFESPNDLLSTIDAVDGGVPGWDSFRIRYSGAVDADSPAWKRADYFVHTRNAMEVMEYMIGNPEFEDKWHTRAFEEYTGPNERRWSDMMSGHWSWKQSDMIAKDPRTHGAMLVPTILGADKTTVSVATGHQEFHPVYISAGNLHNNMRRAHGEGVMVLAFLAIPKACREFSDDDEYKLFRKQLYHASFTHIMDPLKPAMTTPVVLRCPDGHFRRTIFTLGPFIADYPEQVFLASIVSGWCPKCFASRDSLESIGKRRTREYTAELIESFDSDVLWDGFGVVTDAEPFTNHFPRADIHELLTPDLLHQLIKGTFKDHLVTWVEQYLLITHGSKEGKRIMDDIDRRIAAAPAFPGLRRFPEGRNFQQWTGDDSKALMKVFLPALAGYVPDEMIRCISSFLNFAYLARRPSHNTATLLAMDKALAAFHAHRKIFEDTGVRPDGFSLPRQHALVHYVRGIKMFGSPNGLCSSITESKHIPAVKRPWRRSSRNKPLPQILLTNTRLSKLAYTRTDFGKRGMLRGDVVSHAADVLPPDEVDQPEHMENVGDAQDVDGPLIDAETTVGTRAAHTRTIFELAEELQEPRLRTLIRRFLFEQTQDDDLSADDVDSSEWPDVSLRQRLSIHTSASSVFYAPSECSGTGGMHREIIRSAAQWYNEFERRDTVLIQNGPEGDAMDGMLVGRVLRFLSFTYDGISYPCALVNWFIPVGDTPDPIFGMWEVRPEKDEHGERTIGLVHLDCIIRACHLMPAFHSSRIPHSFHFSDSLTAFKAFYVNRYIDYHAHERIL